MVVDTAKVELEEVNVVTRRPGTMKMRSSVMNEDMITGKELLRAACCNLGESFTTNPSVDVSYADAATGAKQIKLLGLAGTYVQILTENIPNYRGAAAPFALGFIPGPWMQSIQVSKGASSVKNGYESITGQINVEFKKPHDPEADQVSANLFYSSTNRIEANADATVKLSPTWSTSLLAHYENETKTHDANHDGFLDIPRIKQYNLWNRWAYQGDRYKFQLGIKAIKEERIGGQTAARQASSDEAPYTIGIETERYEAFTKNAYIFNAEKGTNLALILQGTWNRLSSHYGVREYDVKQRNAYASLMFETAFTEQHSISTGVSYNYDFYRQSGYIPLEKESVAGAYLQYTFNLNDKLILMTGIRGDHSDVYGTFFTPRAHIKYNPNEYVNFRISAGKGYRAPHVWIDNYHMLASNRVLQYHVPADKKMDEAWNYGTAIASYLPILGKTLNLNVEYYYTHFHHQMVTDMDTDPHAVQFYELKGRSYSQSFQVDATYPFFRGFSLTAAYRITDVKTSYKDGKLREKPLTGKYKGLLTASYQTPLGIWQFDATLQLNGGGRMPQPYTLYDGTLSWNARYNGYEQLSAQITRYFRHWSIYIGGENLTNFKQKNPIVDADNPWSNSFDATMVWGPIHGAKAYIGIRWNLPQVTKD
ncbi:MAG: TonB-dependent receptor [Prevotellaceae bacterium]|nr:TonB-dependent receptor [Prevotellaceae bacterium]